PPARRPGPRSRPAGPARGASAAASLRGAPDAGSARRVLSARQRRPPGLTSASEKKERKRRSAMVVTIDGTDWLYGERAVGRHGVTRVGLVGPLGEGIEYRVFLNRFRKNGVGPPPARPGVRVRAFPCPRRLFDLLNGRWGVLPVDRLSGRTDLFHAAGSSLM